MRRVLAGFVLGALALFAISCGSVGTELESRPARPNILLMLVEDLGPRIGAFGDAVARTPNLDRLAREGVRYTHVFASAGVCAPSRAALITGMHQTSITAQHMRSSVYAWADGTGRRGYEATPPAFVKAFPELLRAAGYYTINNSKTDYQFGSPFTIWDENGVDADWINRADGQPFFAMYSQQVTHESGLFGPDGIAKQGAAVPSLQASEARRAALPHRTRPEDVVVPPYYPDTPVVRSQIAQQYDNVQLMDAWVGERLAELEARGVLENTIVIWATDHGDGLPRAKRSLYDSGLHTPMIVRFPGGGRAGQADERMISFVDMAPTILALAGVNAPAHLPGQDAFAPAAAGQEQVFASRDRLDEWPDLGRAIRTRDFKYIRNEYPDAPLYLPLTYRENLPIMAELRRLHAEGALTPLQDSYFLTPRAAEELYDLRADPHETINLADDPAYTARKMELAAALSAWRMQIGDPGKLAEDQLIRAAWGADEQPTTRAPTLQQTSAGTVRLESATAGASIGYRLNDEPRWRLYTAPFPAVAGARVEAKAIRYGFKESDVATMVLK
jgi:N-sulfoglucosamine sulfohydrolase